MPTIKGQKYNIEPKPKIKQVFDKVIENGGTMRQAMLEEGYAENSANNPIKLTNTKSWQKLLDKHLPDNKLTEKHNQLLNSEKEEIAIKALDLGYKIKNKFYRYFYNHLLMDHVYRTLLLLLFPYI